MIAKRPVVAAKFTESRRAEYEGMQHTLHRKEYGLTLYWGGFCGGPATVCNWLTRDDILQSLRTFGFKDVKIAFERVDRADRLEVTSRVSTAAASPTC